MITRTHWIPPSPGDNLREATARSLPFFGSAILRLVMRQQRSRSGMQPIGQSNPVRV